MAFWLMKSEPSVYGLDDLRREPGQRTVWDGVRNYQARNFLRDRMRRGDLALFYHSNCAQPAAVGIMEVVREAYPDPTQFDPDSPYHDPKATAEAPRWYAVDVRYRRRLKRPVTLAEMKAEPRLAGLPLVRRGNRLSVMPVTDAEWRTILALAEEPLRR